MEPDCSGRSIDDALVTQGLDSHPSGAHIKQAWNRIAQSSGARLYTDVSNKTLPVPLLTIGYQALRKRKRRAEERDVFRYRQDGDRWYQHSNGLWLPLISVAELPYFFWNLWRRDEQVGMTRYWKLVQSIGSGFSRDHTRDILLEMRRSTSSVTAESDFIASQRATEALSSPSPLVLSGSERQDHSSMTRSRSSIIDSGFYNGLNLLQSNTKIQLEAQIQTDHEKLLRDLIQDLKRRQAMRKGTIFDRRIPQMLSMLGQGDVLPWATIGTGLHDVDDCDCITATAKDIRDMLSSGCILRSVPHIIRRESERYSQIPEVDPEEFFQRVCAFSKTGSIEVQDHSGTKMTRFNRHIETSQLSPRYRKRRKLQGFIELDSLPINALNIYDLGYPRVSCIPCTPRFRGIQLGDRWSRNPTGGIGKTTYQPDDVPESFIRACADFGLYASHGASSGPHVDIIGHTEITCLSGYKAWCIYNIPSKPDKGSQLEQDQLEFLREGDQWSPVEKFKIILLRPGDTILMPPGAMLVHAPITISDCVMAGGMYIDVHRLGWLARHVACLASNDQATNEVLPSDFCGVWEALVAGVKRDLGVFDIPQAERAKFRKELDQDDKVLREALSCTCADGKGLKGGVHACSKVCGSACLCAQRELSGGSCTPWCHTGRKSAYKR